MTNLFKLLFFVTSLAHAAEVRAPFPTTVDGAGAGVSLSKSIVGDASSSKVGSTAFSFIDSLGNLALPQLNSSQQLPVACVQSTAASSGGAWPVKWTDGTNTAAVKPASTAPLATDPAGVVALSPNGNQATAALQTTGNTTLSTISTALTSGSQKTQVVDASGNVQPSGDVLTRKIFTQPTDGTNNQGYTASSEAKVSVTQPLPAGTNVIGALSSNQSVNVAQVNGVTTSVNTGTSGTGTQRVTLAADGQKTMANGTAVTLASDQSGINSFLDKSASGTLSALNASVVLVTGGMSVASLNIKGTWVGTISFQGSNDGGVTYPFAADALVIPSGATLTFVSSNAQFKLPVGSFDHVQAIMTSYTSGTATAVFNAGTGGTVDRVFSTNASSNLGTSYANDGIGNPITSQPNGSQRAWDVGVNVGGVQVDPRKTWDGTNTITVKAASALPILTDTAQVVTQRPDTTGSVTQTSVSCAGTSTTLLAASTATMFISVRNPTTATQTVWIQFNGSAATAAAPSVDLAPGSEADFFAYGPSYLPTSQFNCISGGSASAVALVYK
jgi:hypothetical protein